MQKILSLLFMLAWPAYAGSLCSGLPADGEQSLYNPGQNLESVEQLNNQWRVTGCWRYSEFSYRPACRRKDSFGELNGRFGSCATFTAFSAFIAILQTQKIKPTNEWRYTSENLVRLYDQFGNPWDTAAPGKGTFSHLLEKINEQFSASLPAVEARAIANLALSYRHFDQTNDELRNRIAQYFTSSPRPLPAELIMDGWVLDRPISEYCPKRNEKNLCDNEKGLDQREAHSALLVGRKWQNGRCMAQVRNSWRGACSWRGYYGRSRRDCDSKTDSLWIEENELFSGVSAGRVP